VLQPGCVRLDPAVEIDDDSFEKISIPRAIIVQCEKRSRIQLRDEAQHPRFDVVHAGLGELDPVVLHGALLESRKRFFDRRAVIDFRFAVAHRDAATLDEQAVSDGLQFGPQLFRFLQERLEMAGRSALRQILLEGHQAARIRAGPAKIAQQAFDGFAIGFHRSQKPSFPFIFIGEFFRGGQLLAHGAHLFRK
jgi:hypothetical protein